LEGDRAHYFAGKVENKNKNLFLTSHQNKRAFSIMKASLGLLQNKKEVNMGIRGDLVGKELCEALGIDYSNVYQIVIDCKCGNAASIEVYKYATGDDVGNIKRVLTHYELKEDV